MPQKTIVGYSRKDSGLGSEGEMRMYGPVVSFSNLICMECET